RRGRPQLERGQPPLHVRVHARGGQHHRRRPQARARAHSARLAGPGRAHRTVLGSTLRARVRTARGVLRGAAPRAHRGIRPPAPRERRAAGRVPERRHRFERGRGDHGAAGPWPGEDVLDRLRGAGLRRGGPRGARGRNFLRHLALVGHERYLDASTLFRRDQKERLFRDDVFALLAQHDPWRAEAQHLAAANGRWLSALQYLDLKSYLPLDILTKVDRMSMAHSIEARVPLLDHKLVEFAATIPPELNLRGGTTKYVFKQAMRGILPDAIIDRP